MNEEVKEIAARLAEPFPPDEIGWKAQTVKGNRALAVAFIDARNVEDRLDKVLGIDGWQDTYQVLPDNSVVCHLRLHIGGNWITKTDVGGESEQPDSGDRIKAAFSDALKRAAVKAGIGRYLYSLPKQWVDYDPTKKQLARTPTLPAWALPTGAATRPTQPTPPPAQADEAAKSTPTTDKPAAGKEPTIDDDQRGKLSRALAAKDRTVEAAVMWLGLPRETELGDLTVGQYDRLMKAMAPQTRKAKRA